jgi:hypothetical protein
VITGDMAHHPCQMAHPDWSLGDDDPKVAASTRSRLFAEWADQQILVIGTESGAIHEFPYVLYHGGGELGGHHTRCK